MANKKLGTLGIVLLALSVVGLILAIVGICVPYFSSTVELLGSKHTETTALFEKGIADGDKYLDFPVAAVQAFSIIAVICTAACVALTVLGALGTKKLGFIVRAIIAGLTVVIALLAIIFAGVYVAQFDPVPLSVGAGAYLLFFGAVMGAVPAALVK